MRDLMEKLKNRGFDAHWLESADEAAAYALGAIASGLSVGIGGSVTIQQLGLYEKLSERGEKVSWHWKVPREQQEAARRSANASDVYLCSANAITADGRLVFIDGSGNRVGALMYGPREVFLIAGVNKLVEGDLADAIRRIKEQACGKNARRLHLPTYCAEKDQCPSPDGCASPARMCNLTAEISRCPAGRTMHVLIVNQELGY